MQFIQWLFNTEFQDSNPGTLFFYSFRTVILTGYAMRATKVCHQNWHFYFYFYFFFLFFFWYFKLWVHCMCKKGHSRAWCSHVHGDRTGYGSSNFADVLLLQLPGSWKLHMCHSQGAKDWEKWQRHWDDQDICRLLAYTPKSVMPLGQVSIAWTLPKSIPCCLCYAMPVSLGP